MSLTKGPFYSNWNIDDIQFSDLAIPEPTILGLSALGGLLLGWRLQSFGLQIGIF
jgi:hypothetical protein